MATNNCSCEMYMYICKQHTVPNSLLTIKLKLLNSLARAMSEGRPELEVELFTKLKSLIEIGPKPVTNILGSDKNCTTKQSPPHVINIQVDKRANESKNRVKHAYKNCSAEICTFCFRWHHNFINCRKRLSLCFSCHSPFHKIAQCVKNFKNYNKFTPKCIRDVPVERKVQTSPKPHGNSSQQNIHTVPTKLLAPTVPVQQNVPTVPTKQIAPTVTIQQNVSTVTTKQVAPIV
ncbi:unnamed protein product, partial [Rotaria magnacalcarata]